MKNIIKVWLSAVLLSSPVYSAVAEEIAVIVNPDFDAASLDKNRVEQIFMGRIGSMRAYDLPQSSPLRREFYTAVTGRSIEQVNATRAKLVLSNRGRSPEELINSRAMKSVVASDPNAIGYIPRSAVDDSVKVLMVLGEETGGARDTPF